MSQVKIKFRSQESEVVVPASENMLARVNHYNRLWAIAHDPKRTATDKNAAVQEMEQMKKSMHEQLSGAILQTSGPITPDAGIAIVSVEVITEPVAKTVLTPKQAATAGK